MKLKIINDHNHDKYAFTPEFNILAARVFNAGLALSNLITKTDFDTELKIISDRVTSNQSKHLLVETELKKLQKFDAAYFRCKIYFNDDGTQNYLVFQSIYKYLKSSGGLNNNISSWKSKRLSDKEIKSFTVSGSSTALEIAYTGDRIMVKFEGNCLKQDKVP